MGGVGAVALVGCADDSGTTTSQLGRPESASATQQGSPPSGGPPDGTPPAGGPGGGGAESSVDVAEGEIPEETGGPYPGDGSNGPNVLTESGVVRSDITSSLRLRLRESPRACRSPSSSRSTTSTATTVTALPGAAIYLWHCDREGGYSLYSEGVTDENYLRGVQEADADGA